MIHGDVLGVRAAFVVPATGSTITLDELAAFCVARLARFKTPKDHVVIHQLPRTENCKTVRGELVDRYPKSMPGGTQ